jgi:hypothetical protein
MTRPNVAQWLLPAAVISLAFVIAFAITFGLFMPIQDRLFPDLGANASLIFLPHGVRVIAAWLYGWRSIILLAPGAVLAHAWLYGAAGFGLDSTLAMSFGLFCAAFSFWLLSLVGMDFRLQAARAVNWRDVLLAGTFASLLNVIGTTYFFGLDPASSAAYLIGDVVGMFAALVVLMLVFRILRRRTLPPDDR